MMSAGHQAREAYRDLEDEQIAALLDPSPPPVAAKVGKGTPARAALNAAAAAAIEAACDCGGMCSKPSFCADRAADCRPRMAAGIAKFLRTFSAADKWPGDDLAWIAAAVEQEAARDA
jgi:hypothetical protein